MDKAKLKLIIHSPTFFDNYQAVFCMLSNIEKISKCGKIKKFHWEMSKNVT